MAAVMPVRALVGAAALTTALGLSVAVPPASSASTVTGRAVTTALPTLTSGATGTYVRSVQAVLAIRVTGRYDSTTAAAVRRLQAWKHLRASGVVTAATWTALKDPTLTRSMRNYRSSRARLPFTTWQTSVHGRAIAYRESHLSCTSVSRGGTYRGKWQMTESLWRAYGGLRYAATPEKATCLAQDTVAYRIWVAGGWGPWGG